MPSFIAIASALLKPMPRLAEELLEAPKEMILTALELERSGGAVIADKVGETACMFLAGLYRAEQAIADRLIRIVNGRLPWTWIDEEKALPWVEKRSGLQLADSQWAAIRLALTAKALVITGGPGVGKTTIVNSVLKILAAKNVQLLLCAPTGRAAKRMTKRQASRRRPSTGSWRSIPRAAGSNVVPTIPSIATCLWSTRLPWSTSC
jgi:AAA domain